MIDKPWIFEKKTDADGNIVGKRSMQFQKFPTLTQDLSRRCIATRGGECCLRTLVDCKRKRYDNAVDVVVRLYNRVS